MSGICFMVATGYIDNMSGIGIVFRAVSLRCIYGLFAHLSLLGSLGGNLNHAIGRTCAILGC